MTNERTPMLAGRTRDNRKIQQIEEFFRLADLVLGELDDLYLAERQKRDCAKQRLARLLETDENAPASSIAIGPHHWIVDVLLDFAAYARNEDLSLVCGYIEYARSNPLEILNARAQGEDSDAS